jgi:ribosomal protein L11 methyltransferase
MNYVEYLFYIDPAVVDAFSGALVNLGIDGLVIEDPGELEDLQENPERWDYLDENLGYDHDEVLIKCYVSEEDQDLMDDLETFLETAEGLVEAVKQPIAGENWAEAWKVHFKSFRVGRRLLIKPTWEAVEAKPGEVVVEIDPGGAFGSGTHETTALCLEAIERIVEKGDRVLDIGCGSGILGLAAAHLGAERVLGIEIDPAAVVTAKDNVKANGLTGSVEIREGDLFSGVGEDYDLIFSNIIADVIIDLAPLTAKYLAEGGAWLVSGILDRRVEDVLEAVAAAGWRVRENLHAGEWYALLLEVGTDA